ncbi:uncharacterized protein TNCV_4154461 [Trichonephila clavipes]|nr:uncharacterized protein TNCV_4154461 [Trichonephila clavipes]
MVLENGCICLLNTPQTSCIGEKSSALAGLNMLEDIIGRVANVPTNHTQPSHTFCDHPIPLKNKYWLRSVVWMPEHAYALILSSETELGFIAENHTSPTCPSELNVATEIKLSLLSHISVEHLANEQDDTTYVLVVTNICKNLLSIGKCPKCDMNDLNIIKTKKTSSSMASKLKLVCSSYEAVLNSSFDRARVKEKKIDINKKVISSILRLGKGHAELELFAIVTGLVIDYEILSKYCPECIATVRDLLGDSPDFAIWCEGHKSECQINHTGSSSSIKMEAAAILWQRSIKECNMCFTCISSD